MFMFRKKEKVESVSKGLGKKAKKFQEVVRTISTEVAPSNLSLVILKDFADKNSVDIESLEETFKTYLRKNAITKITDIKKSNDYTIFNLEEAAEEFGFTLEELS